MSQQVQQIWKEFLKNFYIYITILIAVVLSFFGIVGTISVQIVLSGTLAVLAILAFSVLKNRQNDEIVEKTLENMIKTLPGKNGIYSTREDAYRILDDYVNSHQVKEAVLIQYSGMETSI
jgi:hypothetical protein